MFQIGENSLNDRFARSRLTSQGAFVGLTGVAYFVYLGLLIGDPITPKFVEFYVTSGGAGGQTAEVGFFSTIGPPGKAAGKSMVSLVAGGSLDSLTSAGVKRNTTPFAVSIPTGTYLWAGIRTAMATTQPTYRALNDDWGHGYVCSVASSGVLTGAGPWSTSLIAATTFLGCPDLRLTLD